MGMQKRMKFMKMGYEISRKNPVVNKIVLLNYVYVCIYI